MGQLLYGKTVYPIGWTVGVRGIPPRIPGVEWLSQIGRAGMHAAVSGKGKRHRRGRGKVLPTSPVGG